MTVPDDEELGEVESRVYASLGSASCTKYMNLYQFSTLQKRSFKDLYKLLRN